MKLNVLIVDDEHSGRSSLKILLNKDFYSLFDKIISVSSLPEAIKILSANSFNLCFLDIELNGQSGFDLLPYLGADTKVIFVTAYSQYAIKALKAHAFDYLLKPLDPVEFKTCIKKFEKQYLGEKVLEKHLLVKKNGANLPIRFEEIEYLQANGPYSKIYLINKIAYTTAKTLKILTPSLGSDFIRIHKSYIVNKMMVKSFKKDSLTTIHNTCLPVSRVGAKELAQYF